MSVTLYITSLITMQDNTCLPDYPSKEISFPIPEKGISLLIVNILPKVIIL